MIRRILLSDVGRANLNLMGIVGRRDHRQSIPNQYTLPGENTRKLRAQLILEEAMETVEALGFNVDFDVVEVPSQSGNTIKMEPVLVSNGRLPVNSWPLSSSEGMSPELLVDAADKIIDGCCDTIYVCSGTLCAMGAPDNLHLHEVNIANNAKFPGGQILVDANGKAQKPEGWCPPNHKQYFSQNFNLGCVSKTIMEAVKERGVDNY